jgi:hypothetical protein
LTDKRNILAHLIKEWRDAGMKSDDFPNFETALVKYGKEQRRKRVKEAVRVDADHRRKGGFKISSVLT